MVNDQIPQSGKSIRNFIRSEHFMGNVWFCDYRRLWCSCSLSVARFQGKNFSLKFLHFIRLLKYYHCTLQYQNGAQVFSAVFTKWKTKRKSNNHQSITTIHVNKWMFAKKSTINPTKTKVLISNLNELVKKIWLNNVMITPM